MLDKTTLSPLPQLSFISTNELTLLVMRVQQEHFPILAYLVRQVFLSKQLDQSKSRYSVVLDRSSLEKEPDDPLEAGGPSDC